MARELGTNNLPDCSNMCHEASGRALQASLGTGKGTVDLKDWESADALFILGVNAASNAPRMLTALAEADRRGAQIVHVNPLVEAAATRTIVPHDFTDMALFKTTRTSTLNLQPRIGGDMALLRGMAKAVLEQSASDPKALDVAFIDRHTTGFEEYRALCEATPWEELEHQSGLSRADILKAAQVYGEADRSIVSWCLGLTQHEHGVDTVREIVNLLLLRGNLGREGAGPSPVRGHSNVQGNRTCGIDHRPTDAFLDRLAEACKIDPPREHGLDTVRTIQAMREGEVTVFVGMGGNFALAAPDTPATYAALRSCDLTVQVSTKLNRSHVVHGRAALILPCLGRTEKDHQRKGVQSTSVEDSMSMVHMSVGMKRPASPHLLSELTIVAGMARAALPDSATPWDWYIEDYDRIRDTMAEALDGFEDFNRRVRLPLGFRIKQPARELVFLTPSGRAEFSAAALPDVVPEGRHPGAGHDALARPVEHHHLLRQRPLPGHQEPAHAGLHEPGRHARARDPGHGTRRHHEHGEGRQQEVPERLHGGPVRHPARLCGRVHAGDERALRAGRLQHPERPADHEARQGDDRPGRRLTARPSRVTSVGRVAPGASGPGARRRRVRWGRSPCGQSSPAAASSASRNSTTAAASRVWTAGKDATELSPKARSARAEAAPHATRACCARTAARSCTTSRAQTSAMPTPSRLLSARSWTRSPAA